MAYFRNLSAASPGNKSLNIAPSTAVLLDIRSPDDKQKKEDHQKPLIIFGVDITHFNSFMQYAILASGLLFFMCLYGYYQELVVYGWFNRKLSLFSTFLHFLGCSFFAQLQYHLNKKRLRAQAVASNPSTAGTEIPNSLSLLPI
jgi:hypothetical protein